ncbi:hypothetical protein HYPSUDRAFT_201437 [Hypholoma sublateritium FD-334 SS-4]|uniref:Myosin motor domain-containing protein n=1 Tax=Hypholoma sublateritium (strain FD-334 SS-4) TaxID=945553 RepID=A0A0D2NX97_HYPSF|nr:hypothetical protein HYPSUDRAFT_201437 [Hypholoma sublateritium FD-334 SS-4]
MTPNQLFCSSGQPPFSTWTLRIALSSALKLKPTPRNEGALIPLLYAVLLRETANSPYAWLLLSTRRRRMWTASEPIGADPPNWRKEVGKLRYENSPRVFAVAERAWANMGDEGENQRIFTTRIRAGKTASTKKLTRRLAAIAADVHRPTTQSYSRSNALATIPSTCLPRSRSIRKRYAASPSMTGNSAHLTAKGRLGQLERQFLQVKPLLVAFGNAQTPALAGLTLVGTCWKRAALSIAAKPNEAPCFLPAGSWRRASESVLPKGYMDGREACRRMVIGLELDDSKLRTNIFFKAGATGSATDVDDPKAAAEDFEPSRGNSYNPAPADYSRLLRKFQCAEDSLQKELSVRLRNPRLHGANELCLLSDHSTPSRKALNAAKFGIRADKGTQLSRNSDRQVTATKAAAPAPRIKTKGPCESSETNQPDERDQHQKVLVERDFTMDQTGKIYQAELAQLCEELQSPRDTFSRLWEERRSLRSEHEHDNEEYNSGAFLAATNTAECTGAQLSPLLESFTHNLNPSPWYFYKD